MTLLEEHKKEFEKLTEHITVEQLITIGDFTPEEWSAIMRPAERKEQWKATMLPTCPYHKF